MKTRKLDLHGYTVLSAIKAVEDFIMSSQAINDYLHLHIITGRGKIKEALVEYLDAENYEYFVPLRNDGMIILEIPEDI
jgi:hypothetical protein